MSNPSTPTPQPTWYDILGVPADATPDQIKAAWRDATDKFEPGSGATQFRLFNEAADVLLDPDKRAAYDAQLAAGEPATDEAPTAEAEPAAPAAPPTAPPAPAARGNGLLDRLVRVPVLALAGLAVLLVAVLVLDGFLGVRVQHRADAAKAGPRAEATAERALAAVLSYDYRHMEADRDRALRYLTPKFASKYKKTFSLLTEGPNGQPGGAEKTKTVVKADVQGTGVVDADRDRVRVIAFVNQTSTKGTGTPSIFQNRVVATLVHRGDAWLIDDLKSY